MHTSISAASKHCLDQGSSCCCAPRLKGQPPAPPPLQISTMAEPCRRCGTLGETPPGCPCRPAVYSWSTLSPLSVSMQPANASCLGGVSNATRPSSRVVRILWAMRVFSSWMAGGEESCCQHRGSRFGCVCGEKQGLKHMPVTRRAPQARDASSHPKVRPVHTQQCY